MYCFTCRVRGPHTGVVQPVVGWPHRLSLSRRGRQHAQRLLWCACCGCASEHHSLVIGRFACRALNNKDTLHVKLLYSLFYSVLCGPSMQCHTSTPPLDPPSFELVYYGNHSTAWRILISPRNTCVRSTSHNNSSPANVMYARIF